MEQLSSKEMTRIAVKALEDKKGQDIRIIVNSSKRGHMLRTNGALSPF